MPTVNKLLSKLEDKIGFKGGSTSLKVILRNMGYKWRKTRNNRAALVEKHDIRAMRVSYLRAIQKYRKEGRPIIYEDETYSIFTALTQDQTTGVMTLHRDCWSPYPKDRD